MSSYRYSSHKQNKKPLMMVIGAIAVVGVGLSLYGVLSYTGGEPSQDAIAFLAEAETQLGQGQPEQALQSLDAYLLESGDDVLPEQAFVMKLEALESSKSLSKLTDASALFMTTYPESTFTAEAELMRLTSEIQTAGLSKPGLLSSVEAFLRENPDHSGADRLSLSLARHEMSIGDYSAATRRFNRLATSPSVEPALAQVARQEVGSLKLDELISGSETDQRYKIKSGDSIWKISRDFDVTSELIMMVNRIDDPLKIRPGQELRIPDTNFSLTCDVTRNEMTLTNHGEFVKSYIVRTGRDPGATPEGTFKVLNKKIGPTWRPGDGRVYLPGDPNNELGTRWMAFEGDILGIHGTIHPETVGSYASNGCIGMKTSDVEELFNLIMVGTELQIVGQQDLEFAQIIPSPEVPQPLTKSEIAQLN